MVFIWTWLVGGLSPSEKYDFVNWDDDIPNINGKMPNWWQPTHQPDMFFFGVGLAASDMLQGGAPGR